MAKARNNMNERLRKHEAARREGLYPAADDRAGWRLWRLLDLELELRRAKQEEEMARWSGRASKRFLGAQEVVALAAERVKEARAKIDQAEEGNTMP